MTSEIARQLQVTDKEGREVLYTQWKRGDIEREYLGDNTIPPVYVGFLPSDAKMSDEMKYQQHKRFKEIIAIHTWNISYFQALLEKRFAPVPEPKPKKIWGKAGDVAVVNLDE